MHPRFRLVRFYSIGLLLALAKPGGGQEALPPRAAVRLLVEPPQIFVERGESVSVSVVAVDDEGSPIPGAAVRWAAPWGAVTVSDGQVRGIRPGSYELVVTAVQQGSGPPPSARVPVTVHWPPVARVEVAAEAGRLYAGTTLALAARAILADGTTRPDLTAVWRAADESVATVDRFGNVTAHAIGRATLTAEIEGVRGVWNMAVAAFPAVELGLEGHTDDEVRTGDVVRLVATPLGPGGDVVTDLPVTWSLAYRPPDRVLGPAAPGQVEGGRFVADLPGIYTVIASTGPLSQRATLEVVDRDVVRRLDVVGQGQEDRVRTTAFWVFEGLDGRDYALTGSKRSGGHAFVWDVTDPSDIFKTDSVQVDARSVNDVKVSPDARYATVTREGASNRRNGLVILDLADPAHPVVAAEVEEGLTGGVHNAFPTDSHVFALSDGDKYVILDVRDIYAPTFTSEYDHPDSRLHDVWVHEGIAYSAEWETGVVAVDVGNGRWGGSIEEPVFITAFPVPDGRTHAVFPYVQESTGKLYLFLGDEIMNRRGLAWEGPGANRGSYRVPYDPATGLGGIPLATRGYVQVVDFTDPSNPEMVARYEVSEFGTHNIWVEDDVLYQAYYEGGLRVVDVSGELKGNLYSQGREIAVYKPFDPMGYVPNSPMVWDAKPYKGHVFFSDTNSGLWAVKLEPREPAVM